jgi:hypothetical protein
VEALEVLALVLRTQVVVVVVSKAVPELILPVVAALD